MVEIAPQHAPVLLKSPLSCPHAQHRFRIGQGNTIDVGALFQLSQELGALEPWIDRLPVDAGNRFFIEHLQRGMPGRIETVKSGAVKLLDPTRSSPPWR